jgi:stringent starvation protein B
MAERPTKPYLIRAIHEWCIGQQHDAVPRRARGHEHQVPPEYVKNGEIVLNVSHDATHRLTIGNDVIQFSARFNGVSRECSIPLEAVTGIFAKENGQGLVFSARAGCRRRHCAQSSSTEPARPAPTNGGSPSSRL